MSKKSRRKNVKYPGLEPDYNLKIRHELLDQDYIDKLSDSEKEWLSKFNEEYIACDFRHKKKLHKTKKQKKSIYDANNARNRDAYSITKTNKILTFDIKEITNTLDSQASEHGMEDLLNLIIDLKNVKKSVK